MKTFAIDAALHLPAAKMLAFWCAIVWIKLYARYSDQVIFFPSIDQFAKGRHHRYHQVHVQSFEWTTFKPSIHFHSFSFDVLYVNFGIAECKEKHVKRGANAKCWMMYTLLKASRNSPTVAKQFAVTAESVKMGAETGVFARRFLRPFCARAKLGV